MPPVSYACPCCQGCKNNVVLLKGYVGRFPVHNFRQLDGDSILALGAAFTTIDVGRFAGKLGEPFGKRNL